MCRLPLADHDGFLSVVARLGGLDASMLVDTGSDAGLLDPRAAHEAGARPDGERVPVTGRSGIAALSVASLPSFGLGRLVLTDVAFPLGTLPAMPMLEPPVAGLLGGDVLSAFEVEFDVKAGELALYLADHLSASCRGLPPWTGPFETVPARRQGNRMLIPVRLDGTPTEALLDSGARSRIVSRALALSLGVPAGQLDGEPGGYTREIAADRTTYHWHRFQTLEVAGRTVRNPVLTVAPIGEGAAMLLGADWFAAHRLWISYATSRVFVAPA